MSPVVIGAAGLAVAGAVLFGWRRRRHRAPKAVGRSGAGLGIGDRLGAAYRAGRGDGSWRALEDALVAADVGPATAAALVGAVRERDPGDPGAAREVLKHELLRVFGDRDRGIPLATRPAIVVVTGVNGSGKTTTVAKLAARWQGEGKRVLLGAADTFRAAAAEQIRAWATTIGVDVVAGSAGADPAAVAHDALTAARARGHDVVLVDTAGRLHDQRNLMDELAKVVRILGRESGTVPEVLLVIDASAGQNALAQARAFTAAVGVTGIVLAKLDGSARGGIAVAIERELGIAIKLVGVGEGAGDLRDFVPTDFVDALLEGW